MLLKHLTGLVQEDLGLVRGGVAAGEGLSSSTNEELTLWEEGADDSREGRDTSGAPEERAPANRDLWDEVEVDDGGDEVANGITLLENTGRETARLYRQVFKRGRGGQTPDTAHSDTEERTNGKELLEGLDETRAKLDGGDDDEVEDEGPFTPVAIGDDAKDDLWTGDAGKYKACGTRKDSLRHRRSGRGG